jgi:hypothetical protein
MSWGTSIPERATAAVQRTSRRGIAADPPGKIDQKSPQNSEQKASPVSLSARARTKADSDLTTRWLNEVRAITERESSTKPKVTFSSNVGSIASVSQRVDAGAAACTNGRVELKSTSRQTGDASPRSVVSARPHASPASTKNKYDMDRYSTPMNSVAEAKSQPSVDEPERPQTIDYHSVREGYEKELGPRIAVSTPSLKADSGSRRLGSTAASTTTRIVDLERVSPNVRERASICASPNSSRGKVTQRTSSDTSPKIFLDDEGDILMLSSLSPRPHVAEKQLSV